MTKSKLLRLIKQLPTEPEDNILCVDVHAEGIMVSVVNEDNEYKRMSVGLVTPDFPDEYTLTVEQLRQAIKGLKGSLPVFIWDGWTGSYAYQARYEKCTECGPQLVIETGD
jgi:hypothetical protein